MVPGLHWYDVFGYMGSAIVVVLYFLNMRGMISTRGLSYPLVNLLGCFLIISSLWHDFNLPAFLIEAFWALVSVYGIAETLWQRRARPASRQPNRG